MKLGIDFGTTRIVVAAADRGNYPVVEFEAPDGSARDWFPPLIAIRGPELRFGWPAWAAQAEPGWTVVRSLKRVLAQSGINTVLDLAGAPVALPRVVGGIAAELERALRKDSNLAIGAGEPLEILLGVPAHANSNQRFLTAEAFRSAGFAVDGMLNEPSAASIEFGHSHRIRESALDSGTVLIYDLGGGTFDVSLVALDARTHTVLASEGIETLGGDDFDDILAHLALKSAGVSEDAAAGLTQAQWFLLLEECRQKKEALTPNTRKIDIELDLVLPQASPVTIPVADYFDECRPLLAETLEATDDLLAEQGYPLETLTTPEGGRVEAVYLIGGASELPIIARELRTRFGRKLRRSAHARAATAMGLAIQADTQSGYRLRDRFTRYFGVWREGEGGGRAVFDPLFLKGQAMPGPGEHALIAERSYQPQHNLGHFRYLECSRLNGEGEPDGDITVWDEVRFPFEASLASRTDLAGIAVRRVAPEPPQQIVERYLCEPGGYLQVEIENRTSAYSRTYRLARWAPAEEPVRPGRSRRLAR